MIENKKEKISKDKEERSSYHEETNSSLGKNILPNEKKDEKKVEKKYEKKVEKRIIKKW